MIVVLLQKLATLFHSLFQQQFIVEPLQAARYYARCRDTEKNIIRLCLQRAIKLMESPWIIIHKSMIETESSLDWQER